MKTYTSSQARKSFRDILDEVKRYDIPVGVGRYDKIEVLIIKFPENFNKNVSEATNVNANSSSFDFLAKETDFYSLDDVKELYV